MSAGGRRAPREPGTAELLLASAFLDATPESLAGLRARVEQVGIAAEHVAALEMHGILPLAARNLRLAGVSLAGDVGRTLAERERVLREEGLRNGVTLERLLAAAEQAGVELVLLKGASLALDVYADPLLRSQGDVDVLVGERDVRPLVAAAAGAGLVEATAALPLWWHRLTHIHVKLVPVLGVLKEVEVHWRLHHPALLLCVSHAALRSRCTSVTVAGRRAWSLDELDRFLHLATHLASHSVRLPEEDGDALALWLSGERPLVRLKWLVDLAALAERMAPRVAPGALAARAVEWGASHPIAFVARALRGALPLSARASRWLEEVQGLTGPRLASSRPAPARPAIPAPESKRLIPGLDFRRETLATWPRWLWPETSWWRAKLPAASGPALLARRLAHAADVLFQSGRALLCWPIALVASAFLRRDRRRARARALAPEHVLEVAALWQAARTRAAGPASSVTT